MFYNSFEFGTVLLKCPVFPPQKYYCCYHAAIQHSLIWIFFSFPTYMIKQELDKLLTCSELTIHYKKCFTNRQYSVQIEGKKLVLLQTRLCSIAFDPLTFVSYKPLTNSIIICFECPKMLHCLFFLFSSASVMQARKIWQFSKHNYGKNHQIALMNSIYNKYHSILVEINNQKF